MIIQEITKVAGSACVVVALAGCSVGVASPPIPRTAAGSCGNVAESVQTDRQHIRAGQSHAFAQWPVAGGPHDPNALSAGVYDQPLRDRPSGDSGPTRLRLVHSLEHGYVAIFHGPLARAELASVKRSFGGETKVLVVALDDAPAGRVDLVAWGRIQQCSGVDIAAIRTFVDAYRSARSAPEPDGT
jgi:hypothetical protein